MTTLTLTFKVLCDESNKEQVLEELNEVMLSDTVEEHLAQYVGKVIVSDIEEAKE